MSKLYTVKEVANTVGLTEQSIRLHVKQGKLKAGKFGNQIVINENDFQDYLKERKSVKNELKNAKIEEKRDKLKIFRVIREFASGGGDQTTTLVNRFSTLDKAKNFIKESTSYELIPVIKQGNYIYAVREDTNILDSIHYYIEVEEIN